MEEQTKIGTGAAAGIALMALLEPHFFEPYPKFTIAIYVILIGVTIWGFAPIAIRLARTVIGGFRRMWPQYLMVIAGVLFFIGLVGFLQLNALPPKEKNAGSPELTKVETSVFKFEKSAFIDTKLIRWVDGTNSDLFETRFYLLIGNAMSTGRQIKNAKARIFFMAQEPRLARVKETGELSTDIRHGEWAFFEVGKMVSRDGFLTGGFVTYDDEQKKRYEHTRPEHPKHLEILLSSGQPAYGILQNPDLPAPDWNMLMVVTADDMVSLQLKVSLDFTNKTPITFQEIK
jgi:hypothetical protein